MLWEFGISKKDLLRRQYNLSLEIEALLKRVADLEAQLEEMKKPAKSKAKAGKKKVIYVERKTEKGLDGAIARKIKEGYLLISTKKVDGMLQARMEKVQ